MVKRSNAGLQVQSKFKTESVAYNDGQQKILNINLSDLKLILRDFKQAVRKSDVLNPAIAVVGIWSPTFTSDFHGLFSLTPEQVEGAYYMAALLLSWFLLKNIIPMPFKNKKPVMTSDPDLLAEEMCERKDL